MGKVVYILGMVVYSLFFLPYMLVTAVLGAIIWLPFVIVGVIIQLIMVTKGDR